MPKFNEFQKTPRSNRKERRKANALEKKMKIIMEGSLAAMPKFILEVKDGVSLFMNEHVPYPDGWYWRADVGPYNGPFESIDDAREAAVIASDPGVEIKVIDTEGRITKAPHDPPGGDMDSALADPMRMKTSWHEVCKASGNDYQINVEHDPESDENGTFLITCPRLPEVATFAKTAAEVNARASTAIEEALAAHIAAGTEIPPPVCYGCSTAEGLQRYRFVPRKEGVDEPETMLCTACHKHQRESTRSQAQMEELARLAYEAKRAVAVLEDEFTGLADWPDDLFEMMQRLADAAKDVAKEAHEWASDSNTDLDPSDLTTFSPTDLKRLD